MCENSSKRSGYSVQSLALKQLSKSANCRALTFEIHHLKTLDVQNCKAYLPDS